MKFSRPLVIGMLTSSLLAMLTVTGWWWVTWPERTFRKFNSLIRARQTGAANMMINGFDHSLQSARAIYAGSYLYLEPASTVDLIAGRRRCKSRWPDDPVLYIGRSKLAARGLTGESIAVCVMDE